MRHETSVRWIGIAAGGQIGECSCGQRSDTYEIRQEAEDWGVMHLMKVKTGSLYSGPRKPSLKSLQTYYYEQAASPINPRKQRRLWQQLGDELERTLPKLKRDGEDPNQVSLYDLLDQQGETT